MTLEAAKYSGRAPLEAYGNGGFRFAGMSHRGSILCLSDSIVAWGARDAQTLTPSDFAAVLAERDHIRTLLLGTGRKQVFPSEQVCAAFEESHIAVEAMDTGAACRTYNVLLAEGRPVAAALIAVD